MLLFLLDDREHVDATSVPRLHALPGRHRGLWWLYQLQGIFSFEIRSSSSRLISIAFQVGHSELKCRVLDTPALVLTTKTTTTRPSRSTRRTTTGWTRSTSWSSWSATTRITRMFQITMKLELIYTTVDWPFKNASMNASLFQLGEALFVILMNKK